MSKPAKLHFLTRILWCAVIPFCVLAVGCFLLWVAATTWVLCWPLALIQGLFGFIFGLAGICMALDFNSF